MDSAMLEEHIRALATLPETQDPFVSCYAAVEHGHLKEPHLFDEQIRMLKTGVKGGCLSSFENAIAPIHSILETGVPSDAKGVAFFSRAGDIPHFFYSKFRVSLPTWISVGNSPNVFHLAELKDTYDRYVVMLVTKNLVRIVEINLGEPIEHAHVQPPSVRREMRDRWTKDQYQRHLQEHHHRFIKEQVRVLERLMAAGNHKHLILAGHPTLTARIRAELPKALAATLIKEVKASERGSLSDFVRSTVSVFVEAEERESQDLAESLAKETRSGGLAVVGTRAAYAALERGHVDALVLLRDYEPGPAYRCNGCRQVSMGPQAKRSAACPQCGTQNPEPLDLKEEVVRMAETQHCVVEVVNESAFLKEVGGIGCLLRYRENRSGTLSGTEGANAKQQPMWSRGNETFC